MAGIWIDWNQRRLMREVAKVRACFDGSAAGSEATAEQEKPDVEYPPAIETLSNTFGLSAFERAVLLLCAGMELDHSFGALCAAAQGDAGKSYPTFSLALAALPDAHWSAITPGAPLRHWRLIELAIQPGGPLTVAPLRIDERVLHYLLGIQSMDARLSGLLERVDREEIEPRHASLPDRIEKAWRGAKGRLPVIQLCGTDEVSKRAIACAASWASGLELYALQAGDIPGNSAEFEGFLRLWERESALTPAALYVCADTPDADDSRRAAEARRLLEEVGGAVFVGTAGPGMRLRRPSLSLKIGKPTGKEQSRVWNAILDNAGVSVDGHVKTLVAHFDMHSPAIRASALEALESGATGDDLGMALWDACRAQVRPQMEDLAQRIEPGAAWEDLVLPEEEKLLLREIGSQVQNRGTVYEDWGLGSAGGRGLGITALFAGASGTGKTMAAEVLAHWLRLDLYRIDLSRVVSKYIGETEKNLRRVFDAAEDAGAILFFDEADALFGKRSEVKDSHDRFANIEINYLLQRMEQYRGLAVLATNVKSALDSAFMRRIRFVVNFPFPGAAQRAEMWTRAFHGAVPTEGLDINTLSRLDLTGGNIRNIALNAAFLAAAAGEHVSMAHLWRATRAEYAKLDRPLNDLQFGAPDSSWRTHG